VIRHDRIIGRLGVSGGTWEDGIIARAARQALDADLSGVDICFQDMGLSREKWVSFFFASSIQGNAPLDEIECPLAHRILYMTS
jgi:hypothetical protein